MKIGDKIEFTHGTMIDYGAVKSFMTERFSEHGISFNMYKLKRDGKDDIIINESQIRKVNGVTYKL